MDFVHLHNHTMYSLLDGAIRIGDLVDRAVEWGMPSLAITDHGNMFGIIEFYQAALDAGIKPILGAEVYVAIEGMGSRQPARGMNDGANHLVLLAENKVGYRNLIKVVSAGFLEGFYYRPRVDKDLLREHSEGLIALSACASGEIPHLILLGHPEKAREVAIEYREIFGEGNFYIELQRHGLEDEEKSGPELVKLARELDLPLVATNDAHYLDREHAQAHEVLLCIQMGKTLADESRMRFGSDEIYFRSPEEMAEIFSDVPDALENTVAIASRCNVEIELGKARLPQFPLPEGFDDPNKYLEHLVWRGAKERYPEVTPEIEDRLKHELAIIEQMGFAGYFLVVADYVQYARDDGVLVGLRGSGAASAVGYVIGISDLDPLKYNLIFERFLNPERISPPDFDVDFADRDRDRVMAHVIDKYGAENACQIIAFGTMGARGVIRDVARALDVPLAEADKIAKLIPFDPKMTLDKAMGLVPELKQMAESGGTHGELIAYAKVLEGLARHSSVHAAGVVITPDALTNYMPLARSGRDGAVTTQYDMGSIEKLGLLKMDFLGLSELTVIGDTVEMIRARHDPDFDIEAIPLDDPETFELLSKGDTIGVFQFASSAMQDYLRQLKPENLEDLIAMNALYRPGPMASIPDYIRRKHGEEQVTYLHPALEPILKDTYGIVVYQEQVMQIARDLAGYTMGGADLLRRAMSKKKADVMAEERDTFLKGCEERGIDLESAGEIFDVMEVFSGYGFNRSHAAPYAYIAYRTAYLKAHYPKEFMASNLSVEIGKTDEIVALIEECRRMDIPVLPPDVNRSGASFLVDGEEIRFGLGAIKNVGQGAAQCIVEAREKDGEFSTLFDFCERVDLRASNKRTIESLICAGALDTLKGHRAQLLEGLDQAIEAALSAQKDRARGQISLFELPEAEQVRGFAGRSLPYVEPWKDWEKLTKEKEVLGFFVSGHPLEQYRADLERLTTHSSESLGRARSGAKVRLGGMIAEVRQTTDRNGRLMAFVTLEDLYGPMDAVVFADTYEKYREMLQPDTVILVKGRVSPPSNNNSNNGRSSFRAEEFRPLEEVLQASEPAENGGPAEPSPVPEETSAFEEEASAGVVHLSLHAPILEKSALLGLRELCALHPGPCSLLLHLEEGGEKFVVRSGVTVSATDALLSELQARLGEEQVWIK